MMHSCIYHGYVQHRRLTPAEHAFRYGLYLAYVDLDEMPRLLSGGHGLYRAKFSPASFRRADHVGNPEVPLAEALGNLLEERIGRRPAGPIRLLTPLRNWGYYFSPLSLYYCFDPAGQTVECVVAEVSNTPWLEKHWYVLHEGNRAGGPGELRFQHPKAFHVSPFMDMDMHYEWQIDAPGPELRVELANTREGARLFDVRLELRRREWTGRSMLRTLARYPWMTARVVQAIYWQALLLWRKKTPYCPHP